MDVPPVDPYPKTGSRGLRTGGRVRGPIGQEVQSLDLHHLEEVEEPVSAEVPVVAEEERGKEELKFEERTERV